MRKISKIISVALIFVVALLQCALNVGASASNYYVVGSFNSYKQDESSIMTLNEDGLYEFILDTNSTNLQFHITDGVDSWRSDGKNKGSNLLIKDKGKYIITFNNEATDNKFISINKIPEPDYYVLGTMGTSIADSNKMTYIDRGKYEYIINVDSYSLIYISDGEKEYRDNNGDDYVIKEKGSYRLTLTITSSAHHLTITPFEEKIENYYFLSTGNNHEINEDSKMEYDGSEYYYDINTVKAISFYISDGENSYRDGLVDFLLDGNKSYRIHFNSADKTINIEEIDYYILNSENGFEINPKYVLDINSDNKSYLEYSYLINTTKPMQFIIASKYKKYDDNGGGYIIERDGNYEILFSPTHAYDNGSNVSIKVNKKPVNKYYVVGSFNDYEENIDYLLKYNSENQEYNEFTIDLDLKKGDSFYIKSNDNKYYSPSGEEIKVSYTSSYRIYFSRDYDYGNGYSIALKPIESGEMENRIIYISTKDDLLKLINDTNIDSYSANLTVELKNDINMEGLTISPINIFQGTLNGNYHKIYNFKLDTRYLGDEIGFIRILLSGGEVNSLRLDYSLEIENKGTAVGGIAGRSYGIIKTSAMTGKLKGVSVVGGITGSNEEGSKIIDCRTEGGIIAKAFVGGIAGINNGDIINSENSMRINNTIFSSNDERKILNIGGIAGFNGGKIARATNNGIVGTDKLGGFVGGIAGNSIGDIHECRNNALVLGKKYIGGICGYFAEIKEDGLGSDYDDILKEIEDIINNNKKEELKAPKPSSAIKRSITMSYNEGNVIGGSSVGGICGYAANDKKLKNEFSFNSVYNLGSIEGTAYIGGIIGEHASGVISEAFNTGIITASGDYAGGIAGSSMDTIIATYNVGSIKGSSYVGGICGYANKINNSYNRSFIYPEKDNVGALAGFIKAPDNETFNNFYINNGYKAFSNIDYKGKGEEVSSDILVSKDRLEVALDFKYYVAGNEFKSYPRLKAFISYTGALKDEVIEASRASTSYTSDLVFVDEDGKIIAIERVEYGKDFDMSRLPICPKKEGYLAKWDPSFTGKNIVENQVIRPTYIEIKGSIASEEGPKPLAIIEGEFYNDTRFKISTSDKNYLGTSSAYKNRGSYIIEIDDRINPVIKDNLTISIRVSDAKNKQIAIVKDGSLVLVDHKIVGSYMKFNLNGATEFMVIEKEFYNINNNDFIKTISISGVAVAAALVLALGLYVGISNKKRNNI